MIVLVRTWLGLTKQYIHRLGTNWECPHLLTQQNGVSMLKVEFFNLRLLLLLYGFVFPLTFLFSLSQSFSLGNIYLQSLYSFLHVSCFMCGDLSIRLSFLCKCRHFVNFVSLVFVFHNNFFLMQVYILHSSLYFLIPCHGSLRLITLLPFGFTFKTTCNQRASFNCVFLP